MPGKKRSSRMKWLLIVVVLAVIAVGAVAYVKRPKDVELDFKSAVLTRGEIIQSVTANGNLTPVVNVEVGSQVSGTIEKLFVDFNTKVTNGQILAQIEPSTFEANVMQAEADLANTKAALELARINAHRAEELYKNRLISQSDNDTAVPTLH